MRNRVRKFLIASSRKRSGMEIKMKRENYSPEELLPIVAELAASYTGDEHSSISYEKAGQLMEAVLYCIEEVGEENFAIVSNKMSAKTAYECGAFEIT